jgi:hypothetical protein
MKTKRESTAVEEIRELRHAVLDLARTLLDVATGTIVTAAAATFALANETVANVGKRVRRPAA